MRRAVLLLAGALAAGCGPALAPDVVPGAAVAAAQVVTENGAIALPDPNLRYPDGARVVRVDADGSRTILSDGLAAAGAPVVHHDGDRVLFVARKSSGDRFSVYEWTADEPEPRVLVDHGSDCIRAAYLPDGRIVYAGSMRGIAPAAQVTRRAALFVAAGDGGAGAQISFGAGLDTDPTVLTDGRILFSSWRPDAGGGGHLGLFTVHPDGSGYTPFHLAEADLVYAVQELGGDVRFTQHTTDQPVERIADWDSPMSAARDVGEPHGETVSLAPRKRAQGHLSSVKPDSPYGTLVCVDARANGNPSATQVQIATAGGERAVLGRTPLAADGSFMVKVPPDTPFVVQLFDDAGTLVRGEHGPIWLRGNEVRVCVTCHDDTETSPPNRRPMAVLGEPVDMTGVDR